MNLQTFIPAPSDPLKGRWLDKFSNTESPIRSSPFRQLPRHGEGFRVIPQLYNILTALYPTLHQLAASGVVFVRNEDSALLDLLLIDDVSYPSLQWAGTFAQLLIQKEQVPEKQQAVGSASTKIAVEAELDVQAALKLDEETEDMCLRKDLLPYIGPIYDMIRDIYREVVDIGLERIEDPEITGYEKLCFDIHLKSQRHKMLEDKIRFYRAFFNRIPEDKRQYFVFTYMVS